MHYKGYEIMQHAGWWTGATKVDTAGFSIYKKQGEELINVHRYQAVPGPFPKVETALGEATKAACALIDADGPFKPEKP